MLQCDRMRACVLAAVCVGCPADPGGTDASETSTSTGSTTAPTSSGSSGSTGMSEGSWTIDLELGTDKGALFSVWGPDPGEVYAVGGQGSGSESTGVMLRWDGAQWSEVELPAMTRRLHWIAGVGESLWVVGEGGTALRRDGDVWTTTTTGTQVSLWGVWGASPQEVWTVGGDGFVDPPVLLKFDGMSWQPEQVPALPADSHALFKIWGASASDVTAVGDFGVVLQYDGIAWGLRDVGSIADLISVAGHASERVAVGGRANAWIVRRDGEAWTGVTLDKPGLSGVWVAPDGTATAVGNNGLILRVSPGSLEAIEEESPTYLVLHAAFGFADGPRFAVGGNLTGNPPYIGVVLRHPG